MGNLTTIPSVAASRARLIASEQSLQTTRALSAPHRSRLHYPGSDKYRSNSCFNSEQEDICRLKIV